MAEKGSLSSSLSPSLSLRAWPTKDANADSLPFLISRINEQRGGFRNITEQSLEEEVRAQDAGESKGDETSTKLVGQDETDLKSRREEVIEARDEILKQVAYVSHPRRVDEARSSWASQAGPDGKCLCIGFRIPLAFQTHSPPSRLDIVAISQAECTFRIAGCRSSSIAAGIGRGEARGGPGVYRMEAAIIEQYSGLAITISNEAGERNGTRGPVLGTSACREGEGVVYLPTAT